MACHIQEFRSSDDKKILDLKFWRLVATSLSKLSKNSINQIVLVRVNELFYNTQFRKI